MYICKHSDISVLRNAEFGQHIIRKMLSIKICAKQMWSKFCNPDSTKFTYPTVRLIYCLNNFCSNLLIALGIWPVSVLRINIVLVN